MSNEKINFSQKLEILKSEYAAQLPGKLNAIVADWDLMKKKTSSDVITQLHRNIHSLVGSSGTFGFTEISKCARELEEIIKPLIHHNEHADPQKYALNDELIEQINLRIRTLFTTLNNLQTAKSNKNIPSDFDNVIDGIQDNYNTEIIKDILIYYFSEKMTESSSVIKNLENYGFHSKQFFTLQELTAAIEHQQPHLVIVNFMLSSSNDIFDKIKNISTKNIKIFIFSEKNDFYTRLYAVRAGAQAYVTLPVDLPYIVSLIRTTLELNINKPPHIFIVDDQHSVAQFYANILTHAGMKVSIENDPTQCLQVMQTNRPDLILLDLHMPKVNGDELAAVIRQQEEFQSIPILFLSAETNPERKTYLLEIGSDDLLSKGMPEKELVRQVKSRVARAKILSAMMFQDSLTGLLNHAQIQLAAERVFNQCKRKSGNSSVIVMIDIDKFKKVNDDYGHLTGDRVIKALAQLLSQRLRLTDYIGRFGGEEFMLVLQDITLHDAEDIVNYLRKAFFEIEFSEDEKKFNVSFSAGLSENTVASTFMEQIKFADEALYLAKKSGRNAVYCHNKDES